MEINFEIKELIGMRDKFQKAIDGDIVGKAIENCLLDMGKRLVRKTTKRTPVDTGQLKGQPGWQLSEVIRKGNNFEIVMSNPAEYMIFIELGHRTRDHKKWIPGRFMATISLKEVERELPKYMSKAIDDMFKEILG